MKCREIIELIDHTFPEEDALSWDNVGLQVGRFSKEVKKIYLAVDATEEVIHDAVSRKADLLITHHPMIFSSLKKVNDEDFVGKRVLTLAMNDIAYYAMHTNYDIYGMADQAAKRLGLEECQVLEVSGQNLDGEEIGIGKVGSLKESISLRKMAELVKRAYNLEAVRVFGNPEQLVRRVAICPGSGKSEISEALEKGADVFVTGDIGHHDGIDAVDQGLAIIDAGHYGVEHIFIEDMHKFLENNLHDVEIIDADIKHPFFHI